MGANQSQAHNSSRPSGSGPSTEQVDTLESTDDLYAVLQVSPDASSEEIKKAFRRLALIHHPDKNFDNVETATKNFAKIQQAYEILSDDDERAFYDRHRDELLDNKNDDDFDPTQLKSNIPRSSLNPGLTTKQILKFFDASLWKGDFSDSTTSFFTIYRNLFNQLAVEEKVARKDTTIIYPSFGTSQSSYDQDHQGAWALKHFYSIWMNFSTQKNFEWVEPHHTHQQADRRIKRLIEKENQRERENARREYNETIRSLVSFVKKRDPRFASSTASNPEKWRAQEIQRIKRELKEVAEKRAKEREEEARQFREQAWQRQKDEEENEVLETDDDQGGSNVEDQSEDEELEAAPNDWYCVACGKEFNSQGAWDNHERSKKHRQNAQRLRKQMLKEDVELSLSTPISSALASQTESPSKTVEIKEGLPNVDTSPSHVYLEDSLNKFSIRNKSVNKVPPTTSENESLQLDETESRLDAHNSIDSLSSQLNEAQNLGEQNCHKQTCVESQDNDDSDTAQFIETMTTRKNRKTTQSISNNSSRTRSKPDSIQEDEKLIDGQSLQGSSFSNASKAQPNGMSKKDKRRAKEAAKKSLLRQGEAAHSSPHHSLKCNVCDATFDSKNKLFEHIKRFGHASATSSFTSSSNGIKSTSTTRKPIPNKPKAKTKKKNERD